MFEQTRGGAETTSDRLSAAATGAAFQGIAGGGARGWIAARCIRTCAAAAAPLLLWALLAGGCAPGPRLLGPEEQVTIDRSLVEYPSGHELKPIVRTLTAPAAIAFDEDGSLLIAEGAIRGAEPRIFGFREDGREFTIYPRGRRAPGFLRGFRIYGPVGGMIADQGRVYVSHCDENGRGVITAFDYEGNHYTVVADLPAQGDHGVTDLAIAPNGRLYFGVGTATNSGVVGIDNWDVGWARRHARVADVPWVDLKLLGYRFDTRNPRGGLFGGDDIAVTAPFQPFGTSNQTRVRAARNNKPNGAIYSVNPSGGDLRVEAHGIRYPRGLRFNEYARLYFTNNGMELRGTRPVKDDPDALLRMVTGTWYGWPDFTADLQPVTDVRFQPPVEMIIRTGYPDLSFLIDHAGSGLVRPDRGTLLQAAFPSLSGAAKMDFVPAAGPFSEYRGNAIIALSGDRAPFATSGQRLIGPIGHKIVRVDVDTRQMRDFIRNTRGVPASRLGRRVDALERPVDVKFGPDGALYILDFGRMEMAGGRERPVRGTGRILKLEPAADTAAQE